ncbi:uracil-DNA glycosylase [Prosthecomicrobium pneumaticum]|uniref:Type-4 uracil-DNA glycosylase n=1 Tax=Prosthecomicrobium pneumaticum TaxID=81895 RepID=A0A7W9L3F1_9HYPH|nr:uracil-DNA glycosylase [Prosthecomicrobium pneumaticum]MBB5754492.1 DNA polymerase [Prosthecomicrobium pneumaticum]
MTPEPPTREALAALIAWYQAMGVDAAIEEEAVDRFAAAAAVPVAVPPPVPTAPAPAIPPRTLEAAATAAVDVETVRALARSAPTLSALRAALEAFEGCGLSKTANRLVFGDGAPGARLMLVGEAPGREEDLQGLPFVGPSGRLLERMLAAIGLSREAVYIANVVPWRPPANRKPTPEETTLCKPFLERQIELVDPDVLVCLGDAAAKEILGVREGILSLRGRWFDFPTGRRTIRAVATLHPAYLLRQPLQKRLAWRDLLAVKAALDGG